MYFYLHDFIWEIGHGSFDRSNNSFCSCNFKEFSERVPMTLPLWKDVWRRNWFTENPTFTDFFRRRLSSHCVTLTGLDVDNGGRSQWASVIETTAPDWRFALDQLCVTQSVRFICFNSGTTVPAVANNYLCKTFWTDASVSTPARLQWLLTFSFLVHKDGF